MLKKLENGLSYIAHSGVEKESPSVTNSFLNFSYDANDSFAKNTKNVPDVYSDGGMTYRNGNYNGIGNGNGNHIEVIMNDKDRNKNLIGFGMTAVEVVMKNVPEKARPKSIWGQDSNCGGKRNYDGTDYNLDLNVNLTETNKSDIFMVKRKPTVVNYTLVSRSYTTSSGMCRSKIPLSGSYIIKIVSKQNKPYSSNVIKIDKGASRILYAASLRPAMLRVVLCVMLPSKRCTVTGTDNGNDTSTTHSRHPSSSHSPFSPSTFSPFSTSSSSDFPRQNASAHSSPIKQISKSHITNKNNLNDKNSFPKKLISNSKNTMKNFIDGNTLSNSKSDGLSHSSHKIKKNNKSVETLYLKENGCLMSLINVMTGERHLIALSLQQSTGSEEKGEMMKCRSLKEEVSQGRKKYCVRKDQKNNRT